MFKQITKDQELDAEISASSAGKRKKSKRWPFFILVILAAIGIISSTYYYRQYRALKANPNLEAQKEAAGLVESVSKLMDLPADEIPTIATVQAQEKLKDQPFFKNAKNGDKLLAYTKAMKAILYRPSTNRIIEVAPIYINQPTAEQTAEQAAKSVVSAGLKIAYYNGTETAGLSGQAEKTIKSAYPHYQTVSLTNASEKDYAETLVIDLSGTHGNEVGELAVLLGGRVSSLPEGETRPDADILVISGK